MNHIISECSKLDWVGKGELYMKLKFDHNTNLF